MFSFIKNTFKKLFIKEKEHPDLETLDQLNAWCEKQGSEAKWIVVMEKELEEFKQTILLSKEQNEALNELLKDLLFEVKEWRNKFPDEKINQKTIQKDDIISDGSGGMWSAICPQCGEKSMVVVRPGKIQCNQCD